jgi:zinc protease
MRGSDSWNSDVRAIATTASPRVADPDVGWLIALYEACYGTERRYSILPTADELATVDAEGIERVWRERFSNLSDWVIVLTGDIDRDTGVDFARRNVGTLEGDGTRETAVDYQQDQPPGIVERTVYAGAGDTASVARIYTTPTEGGGRELVMTDLLEAVMGERLDKTVREELGATYSPTALSGIVTSPDVLIEVYINVSGDPDRIGELSEVISTNLEDLATNGPTDAEFAAAVAAFELEYQQIENWLLSYALVDNELLPGTLDDFYRRPEVLASITSADLAGFAARALPAGQFVEVRSLPQQ